MRNYHLCIHALRKIKINRPCASQISIGVIIVLSLKTQLLFDVLIGRELHEVTPTAVRKVLSTTGQFMTNPGASDKRLAAIF